MVGTRGESVFRGASENIYSSFLLFAYFSVDKPWMKKWIDKFPTPLYFFSLLSQWNDVSWVGCIYQLWANKIYMVYCVRPWAKSVITRSLLRTWWGRLLNTARAISLFRSFVWKYEVAWHSFLWLNLTSIWQYQSSFSCGQVLASEAGEILIWLFLEVPNHVGAPWTSTTNHICWATSVFWLYS